MKKIFGIVGVLLVLGGALFVGSRFTKKSGGETSAHLATLGTLVVDKSTQVAEVNIETGGGTVIVTEKDTPISGLEIAVPASSYREARDFKISYSPIRSHTFGENVAPLTPLISVDDGGGYSDELMEVKIPVKVCQDSLEMSPALTR